MQSQASFFSGERLELARNFRGWTQKELAERVAAATSLISHYESGRKRDPSEDLLFAFAEALGFESGYFFEPVQDPFLEKECSFRHRRSTPKRSKAQIRAHGTLLGMLIAKLREHFDFPELDIPRVPFSIFPDIEEIAQHVRTHWRLGSSGPLLHVGRVLEHAGIPIVKHLANTSKVDAFSRDGRTSIIFLNGAIPSTSRWNFDLAHECGHLVMHSGLITGDPETEKQADSFASAFLMPRVSFAREFALSSFSWTHVFNLKARWSCSAAAIIRRAYDLRLITPLQYRRAYQYMSARRWNKGEPHEPPFQDPELLASALNGLGRAVGFTAEDLRRELFLPAATFEELTGISLGRSPQKRADVIEIRSDLR